MAAVIVKPLSSVDMIGPYLAAQVPCPVCSHMNVLLHIEGPTSPVKTFSVCTHIRAHVVTDDGCSEFEFER